jgi:hypothetical protein
MKRRDIETGLLVLLAVGAVVAAAYLVFLCKREARARAREEREEERKRAAAAWEREWRRIEEERKRDAAERERDRPAREERERKERERRERVDALRRAQTPLGDRCAVRHPQLPNDNRNRRKLGFFVCASCDIGWSSNDCWPNVAQACPNRHGCPYMAVLPFRLDRLDRDDAGVAVRSFRYQGAGRSFGRYECTDCARSWASAHAWRNETQACHACRRPVAPFWQELLRVRVADGLERGQHDTEGCSKCRKLAPNACYNKPAAEAAGARQY